ncbi:hypothetical protein M0P65_06385 [Candidatus Gracilibacteria bacterium]|nr:hypothetical protein [Candidatus Gracilibacteria bacterium]
MVNITKGGDEGAPKVNAGRRDFLKQSLTGGVALGAMGILGAGLTGCKTQKDRDEEITKIQPLTETKDFDESLKNTIENLMDLYESLELRAAKEFYTTNKLSGNVYLLNIVALALNDITRSQLAKMDDNIKQRMNNMIFKINNKHSGQAIIEEGLQFYSSDLFAKKYPQLVPVIEEWKKKNGK